MLEAYGDTAFAQKVITGILEDAQRFEKEWGIDCSVADTEQLQILVNHILRHRRFDPGVVPDTLSKYAAWRKKKKLPSGNAIRHVVIDPAIKVRRGMVYSPTHLSDTLNTVFPPTQEDTTDILYCAYLWLAFSGLEEEQAMRVKSQDLNFDISAICIDGEKFPIYPDSLDAFYDSVRVEQFTVFRTKDGKRKPVDYLREPGDELLRGKQNNRGKITAGKIVTSFRPTISRRFAEIEAFDQSMGIVRDIPYEISYDRVYLSGIYYRALKWEQAHHEPYSFTREAEKRLAAKYALNPEQFDSWSEERRAANNSRYINRVKQKMREEFLIWKQAFTMY